MNFRRLINQINVLRKKVDFLDKHHKLDLSKLAGPGDYIGDTLIVEGAGNVDINSAGQLAVFGTTGASWETPFSTIGGSALLGVSISSDPGSDGVLIRGLIKINSSFISGDSFTVGQQVYMHKIGGIFTSTAPTAEGSIVRVVGHAIDSDIIYFNPSRDYIVI